MTPQGSQLVRLADGGILQVSVDRPTCVGSGMCNELVPALFRLDDSGKTRVVSPVGAVVRGDVEAAAEVCPVAAIGIIDAMDRE